MSNPFSDPQPQSLDSVSGSLADVRNMGRTMRRGRTSTRRCADHAVDVQNPFADPAVQAGLNSHAHEEYDAASFKGASTYDLPDQQAASASGNADMQARLADLQRREQELAVSDLVGAGLLWRAKLWLIKFCSPGPTWALRRGKRHSSRSRSTSGNSELQLASSTKTDH